MTIRDFFTSVTVLALLAGAAHAEGAWSSFPVYNFDSGSAVESSIEPVASSTHKWQLCAILPHMKDGYWISVDYGLVDEARRLGVELSILQAGGYSELVKQVSQYDDCVASGADAVLIAPISESGLEKKIRESAKNGLVQIGFVNPIHTSPTTSKIFVDYATKGRQTGAYLVENLGDAGGNVVALPGPQGSGWAEAYMDGFREALEDSNVKIVAEKFGPAGVAESLTLIEDSLQSFDDLNAIWGGAPAAEAAIGAVEEAGLSNIIIVASYENQTMVDSLVAGEVTAFGSEFPVMQGRIAVNLAVAALQGEEVPSYLEVIPQMVTVDNVENIDLATVLAPKGFQPEFSVE